MKRFLKQFGYYGADEKRAIVLLLALILAAIGAYCLIDGRKTQRGGAAALDAARDSTELASFIAGLEQQKAAKKTYRRDTVQRTRQRNEFYRKDDAPQKQQTWKKKKEEKVARKLVPFDPNTADSLTFRQLGLSAWATKNALKYRKKGGRFRKPDDFKKIYGLDEELFEELRPYIQIGK